MKISLCENIRSLRRKNGITQEQMADALGVTAQAVSRWESAGGYPDMELIPAIANYLGVTTDMLFGVDGDRKRRIDSIIKEAESAAVEFQLDDSESDSCIDILREELAEFPGDESLTYKLADTLSSVGWMRHKEWMSYGDDGHIQHCFDRHNKNEYWKEAMKLYEGLISSNDAEIRQGAIFGLLILKRNIGEYDRACELASMLPPLRFSREIMLCSAVDGKRQAGYLGETLLELAYEFAEQMMYALINDINNYGTDMPIEKAQSAAALFDLIGDGSNLGVYEREIAYIYLYISRLQWEKGYQDKAFESLYIALERAERYDSFAAANPSERRYDCSLLKYSACRTDVYLDSGKRLAGRLPEDWPMWCNPDYSKVESGIKADPRWKEWEKRCRGE